MPSQDQFERDALEMKNTSFIKDAVNRLRKRGPYHGTAEPVQQADAAPPPFPVGIRNADVLRTAPALREEAANKAAGFKKGGKIDGIAQRGKTRGKLI